MTLSRVEPAPLSDYDGSAIDSPATPTETVCQDLLDGEDPFGASKPASTSVPWPGTTYAIRSIESWNLLTLLDGQVLLAPADGRGSTHWECVETKGWLGFRNPISGRFLGHDPGGKLICSAKSQQGWENFCARARPDGGFVLLMTHFERLWHVGSREEQGVQKLMKIGDGAIDGEVWEFVPV